MARYEDYVQRGIRSAQPVATAVAIGCLYCVTDEGFIVERSNGTTWQAYGPTAGIGDVVGPASSVASEAVLFDGTSGKLLKRATGTGIVRRTSGVDSVGTVLEGDLGLTDITTGNVSTSAHGFAPKAPNDATKFLNGANPPAWTVPSGGGSGAVAQVTYFQTGAVATGAVVIPMDDSIPQNTEGYEFMTHSHTPLDAANLLQITVTAHIASATVPRWMLGALFKDSGANALASTITYIANTSTTVVMRFTHTLVAGSTSAQTFKFRAGSDNFGAAATLTFNGSAGSRYLGGVLASGITIIEIVP